MQDRSTTPVPPTTTPTTLVAPRTGHVVVLGMMAAGKTTVGSRLAKRLGRRFLDSDLMIHQAQGATVRELERRDGLPRVHELEWEALREALDAPRPVVVAAAASVVDHPEAATLLAGRGLVAWLRITPETMLHRMEADPDERHRPTLGAAGPRSVLESLRSLDVGRRARFEALADLVLDVDSIDPDHAADRLRQATNLPELVVDAGARLGEGPLWDPRSDVLWWVDLLGEAIHRHDPADGSDRAWATPRAPTALACHGREGLVVTTPRGIEAFHPERPLEDRLELLIPLEADDPDTRTNDAKCDPEGNFLVGTMDWRFAPGRGRLYRVHPDGTIETIVESATIPNGLCWSGDGRRFHWIDTPTHRVDVFEVDPGSGRPAGRRHLAPADGGPLNPDGMTIDREDCLWVAHFADGPGSRCAVPGGITRFSPAGEPLLTVELPATYVTSVCFGGPGLEELYITTGPNEVPEPELVHEPHAGGLFRWRPGVGGRLLHAFGPHAPAGG